MSSSIITIVLLTVIAVSLSAAAYVVMVSYGGHLPSAQGSVLVIEEAVVSGGVARLYITNKGTAPAVLSNYYVLSGDEVVASGEVRIIKDEVVGSEFGVSPGDTYRFVGDTVEAVESSAHLLRGLGYGWSSAGFTPEAYLVTDNSAYFTTDYLQVSARRSTTYGWGTYSMLYSAPVNVSEGFVVEVSMEKVGWNSARWWFSAALYITSSAAHPDPYFDTPWIALKLYPRYSSIGTTYTEPQIVGRTSTGDLGIQLPALVRWGRGTPSATFLLIVEPGEGGARIRYCFWDYVAPRGPCSLREVLEPAIKEAAAEILAGGEAWVFLTIETATNYYVNSVRFYHVRVFEGVNITVTDLPEGAVVRVSAGDRVLAESSEDSGTATIDGASITAYGTPPIDANITVEYTVEAEAVVPPGGTVAIEVPVPDSRVLVIKVASRDGSFATIALRRTG